MNRLLLSTAFALALTSVAYAQESGGIRFEGNPPDVNIGQSMVQTAIANKLAARPFGATPLQNNPAADRAAGINNTANSNREALTQQLIARNRAKVAQVAATKAAKAQREQQLQDQQFFDQQGNGNPQPTTVVVNTDGSVNLGPSSAVTLNSTGIVQTGNNNTAVQATNNTTGSNNSATQQIVIPTKKK